MIASKHLHNSFYIIALLFAFSLPLSRAGINIFGFLLLVLWILQGRFKEKFLLLKSQAFIQALALFALYQLLTFFWIEPQHFKEAISYDFKYIYFLIIPVLYTSFESKRYRDLLYAFFAGMLISLLQSLCIYFDIYQFHEVNAQSLSPHMWHTIYSIFLAFSALSALIFSLEDTTIIKRITFGILFILTTLVLFLGISRTGQALYLFGFLAIMIALFRVRLSRLIMAIMILLLSLFALYHYNKTFQARIDIGKKDIALFNKDANYCTSLGGRLFTWKIANEVFHKDPILGMGTIDHIDYLQKRMNEDEAFSHCGIKELIGYYHAQYIEIVAQSGILGLFLLLFLFYKLATIKNKDETLTNIKYLFIMLFLLAFFVDVPLRKMFTLGLFALVASTLLLEEKTDDEI